MQKGPPFRGDRLPIGTPEQRVHIGFHDSWKPRVGMLVVEISLHHNLKRTCGRIVSRVSQFHACGCSRAYTRKRLRRAFSAYALPRAMPHVPVNEEPGSSRIRASIVRNAFGGQVIGSMARLRRLTLGSGSPLKSIKYG
jgi:hypothetical protein